MAVTQNAVKPLLIGTSSEVTTAILMRSPTLSTVDSRKCKVTEKLRLAIVKERQRNSRLCSSVVDEWAYYQQATAQGPSLYSESLKEDRHASHTLLYRRQKPRLQRFLR